VRRARQRLGIKDVVAYHARGDLASRLHAAGVDAATIAEILGHKDISQLRTLIVHYLRVDRSVVRKALESISLKLDPQTSTDEESGRA
jgi:integrase